MTHFRGNFGVEKSAVAELALRARNRSLANSASALAVLVMTGLFAQGAIAADATWDGSTGQWSNPGNWIGGVVPDGTATFSANGASTITPPDGLIVGGELFPLPMGAIVFDASAQAYTFNFDGIASMAFTGAGIVNNSSQDQTFNNSIGLDFDNSSSMGNTIVSNLGGINMRDSSSAGSATITNPGSIGFLDTSSAGTAKIFNVTNPINNGLLRFFQSSTAGQAEINNASGATLQFLDASSAGNAQITNESGGNLSFGQIAIGGFVDTSKISSGGNSTIINDGSLTFGPFSTAGNANITNNGTMMVTEVSNAGSATIVNTGTVTFRSVRSSPIGASQPTSAKDATITNNGRLEFVDNATGGNAAINNGSTGIVDFSATRLAPTIGSIAGSGNIYLGQLGLSIGGNNLSTVFSGSIGNCAVGQPCTTRSPFGGRITKTGTGTLTLAGTNAYLGPTEVLGGTLLVNGSISSSESVFVGAGGTVGGVGTLSSTIIDTDGTLGAGNSSIGTLTVAGDLTLKTGSKYAVDVSPTVADKISVTGSATLAGAVEASFGAGSYLPNSYVILSATGGFGGTTFDAFNIVDAPALQASLAYSETEVSIDLVAATAKVKGLTDNQQAVAEKLDEAFNGGGGIGSGFATLLGLPQDQLVNGLSQLSGEAASGAIQTPFHAMDIFLGVLLDPTIGRRAAAQEPPLAFAPTSGSLPAIASAYGETGSNGASPSLAAEQPTYGMWGSVYGGQARLDADAVVVGTHETHDHIAGLAAGIDYRLGPDTVAGFALSGGTTSWSLDDGLGDGESNMFQAGVYGKTHFGAAYLSGALAYAWHDVSTSRTVTIAGTDVLAADFDANVFGARVEGGYRFDTPVLGITPYAAFVAESVHTPSYSEYAKSGSAQFALDYASRTTSTSRSEIGTGIDKMFALDDGTLLTLQGRAAWVHDFDNNRSISTAFQSLPGSSFSVDGAVSAEDSALLSASVEIGFAGNFTLGGRFNGEFSSSGNAYSETVVLKHQW